MATGKPEENDASLPFAALQLLAPPVRLVSAALWKVMKQRDVMQYGVVEEFVTSSCEVVPGLLTLRHWGKLALGLRGRLILELCSNQSDKNVVLTHLERIRAPAIQSSSSAPSVKRDLKVQKTVESFRFLVQTLLADPAERERFFKEEFPVDYGPKFDQELEKLLWEFLLRVDQLLPVPNLAKTVSWLSETPSVLEECARAATQPQLLKILLQHQTCLGHLETAASLPPNMGDSILASLSLPPSGKLPSDDTQKRDRTFITPVFGTISNDDVPVLLSANKKREDLNSTVAKPKQSEEDFTNLDREDVQERNALKRTGVMKRKQPDRCESDEGFLRSGKKRTTKSVRKDVSDDDEAKSAKSPECDRTILETFGLREDPHRPSMTVSSLENQPKVVVGKKLETSAKRREKSVKFSCVEEQNQRRNQTQKPDSDDPDRADKENYPTIPRVNGFPSQQRSSTEALDRPGHVEDYVPDSEDEATKNFKCRLFMRRYFKTKHGTYVPTLREFWRPGKTRQHL
ncbi:TERF1-interacting nuclear factor 2 [Antennarius striatus]|uniref:TERF1-interacting nuclear factor 2 n=1 Tax=Antennarius striatus TaxID=241820 RepID=UPI0035B23063